MGFKANWSEAAQSNSLKPEGDYECLIAKVEERVTKNGKENLNISMVIRNDVEQNYKNGYIFDTLWKKKEPTKASKLEKSYKISDCKAYSKADDNQYSYSLCTATAELCVCSACKSGLC